MRGKKVVLVVPDLDNGVCEGAAIVQATLADGFGEESNLPLGDVVQGAVMTAVTRWVNRSKFGQASWEASDESFNVGDLATVLPVPDCSLRAYLADMGILEIEIQVHKGIRCGWDFVDKLVNENELDEGVAVIMDAIGGLKEYYPCLQDRKFTDQIHEKVTYTETGDLQADYEKVKDQVEKLAEAETKRRWQEGGN